jgi:hypothetical protein
MKLEILHRCLVFLGEFSGVFSRCAECEFAMPALETSAAKGKRAVLADSEKILSCNKFLGSPRFSV